MPLIAWISLLILTLCAVGSGVYWGIVWARVLQTQRGLPTARMGLGLPAARELQEDGPAHPPAPTVCVIIPAHNEQATIAGLATSLRLQDYPRFRVIFALDRCTDGTEAALRRAIDGDHRFDIVLIHQCPEGWAGKVHAIWSALQSPRPSPHPPPPPPPPTHPAMPTCCSSPTPTPALTPPAFGLASRFSKIAGLTCSAS